MNLDHQNTYFTCPMHPEVRELEPGTCPYCGMDLVSSDSENTEHDHSHMMSSPEAAADFLRRFWWVTILLVPLIFFSKPAINFLGIKEFFLRPYIELGIATIIFYFGLIFFKHAQHEIKMKQYGMMTLVSLGVGSGYLFSLIATFLPSIEMEFYVEISTLIWVLLFGHFLEAKSSTAAGDALQEVAKLLPKEAHLKDGDGFKDVSVETLQEGDVVLVKPGEKVPADGEITQGTAQFDQSHLTGESKPVTREEGDIVPAGAISLDGAVEIRLSQVGESSTIGQIKQLISQAKETKPTAQRLADKAAKWLTFSALTISFISLIVWLFIVGEPLAYAATLAITVLVIACPHALGLAIPTVTTIATRLAVKNGIFIKDLAKIETIQKADYVVFDKTGTLTKGEFGVSELKIFDGDSQELLKIIGAIELASSHVIAQAIVAELKDKQIKFYKATDITDYPGKGVKGVVKGKEYFLGNQKLMREQGVWNGQSKIDDLDNKTLVYLSSSDQILAVIALSDQVKTESAQSINQLHQLGLKVAMITGDNQDVAESVAEELKIDTVFAEVLPEDKYQYIKKLQKQGNVVIMAGDGVNDAPALTQADVGIAIAAGTDVAVEAGDVVLTESNPQHVVRLVMLARKVYQKMIQNLFWALGYNVIALPAAAGLFIPLGFRLSPAAGALMMSLSSVVVVINALSLKRINLTLN